MIYKFLRINFRIIIINVILKKTNYSLGKKLQHLNQVWQTNKATDVSRYDIAFDDLTNSIISTRHFYYYIVDFYDMSLSHISPSLYEMHGFDSNNVTINDILETIHPDDVEFVVKAEAFLTKFFYEKIGPEKLLSYKISYSHQTRFKNGEYALMNH